MHITNEEMNHFPFQSFRKTTLFAGSPFNGKGLSAARGPHPDARRSPVGFEPGDYLARGIQDEEWPITQVHFVTGYETGQRGAMPKGLPPTVPERRVTPTKCLKRLRSPDEQEEIPLPATQVITLCGQKIGSGGGLQHFRAELSARGEW